MNERIQNNDHNADFFVIVFFEHGSAFRASMTDLFLFIYWLLSLAICYICHVRTVGCVLRIRLVAWRWPWTGIFDLTVWNRLCISSKLSDFAKALPLSQNSFVFLIRRGRGRLLCLCVWCCVNSVRLQIIGRWFHCNLLSQSTRWVTVTALCSLIASALENFWISSFMLEFSNQMITSDLSKELSCFRWLMSVADRLSLNLSVNIPSFPCWPIGSSRSGVGISNCVTLQNAKNQMNSMHISTITSAITPSKRWACLGWSGHHLAMDLASHSFLTLAIRAIQIRLFYRNFSELIVSVFHLKPLIHPTKSIQELV